MKSGRLLDIGAGHGRHAIFFAKKGFEVTAVEPDKALCEEIKQKAQLLRLSIQVIQADFDNYKPNQTFDAIVCAMVLHFLGYDAVKTAVSKMQSLTKNKGCNVISAYTNQNVGDFMKDNPFGKEEYLLKPNELKELYSGWNLLEYSEAWTEPGIINPNDVPTSYHKVNMIAQKE
jgi:cyclopropane fatty-acyl-phospholipid synthase-like methyltransferase